LETNIDDMTAEHLQFCVERLFDAGAADAWTTPIVMKKGRGACTLHCLCQDAVKDLMLQVIFRHSTTLGVRQHSVDRTALFRKMVTVQTEWNDAPNDGRVDVKIAYLPGETEAVSTKAEFDQCRLISLATNIPIYRVADQAVRLAHEQIVQQL
jgi:pyridinium-3,5-bisthiocarboxylic acid mononucleotide nickel chelatase